MSIKVFYKLYLVKREEIDDTIAFLSIIIKVRYNTKYLTLNLKKKESLSTYYIKRTKVIIYNI